MQNPYTWARRVARRIARRLYVRLYGQPERLRIEAESYRKSFKERVRSECESKVATGLFKGLTFSEAHSWGNDLGAMLLGSYEKEVLAKLNSTQLKDYAAIVDVGCADGFYAIGLARICPNAKMFAYDLSARARQVTTENARLNDVLDRIEVREFCDPVELQNLSNSIKGKILVIVDIEGAETDLICASSLPALESADLLVECHDRVSGDHYRDLENLLKQTHSIERILREGRNPNDYPSLEKMPDLEFVTGLCEMRSRSSSWLWAKANS
ncbi:50S ribosomal protein L11 methyltransferase [Congregibacter brevis]|uniref:50S ribosomal protein L11 methyltransferase n=1 Tax=Congregibacter brevis TaxID=3081201 RepID=A0ABZ0IFI1_9GAMM|nr:50S ribosomal protein L11 methyltransferase [Congregibacter sp. IMCC45268]